MTADRMKKVRLSGTLKYMARAREMRQAGFEVIDFSKMPDTPQHIKDAARVMLDTPAAALYTDIRGLPELRNIIAHKLKEENNIDANPDDEIIVTVGGKSAILTALLALVNPGDEIMIEDPAWVTYEPCVHLAGGIPIPVPLLENEGWTLSNEEIEKRITPKTKMIILCNPNNPTGMVLKKREIEAIIDIVEEHELLILVDEAYEKYVYDGLMHYSIASFPDMAERTITIQGVSKHFNMFGWRIGWVTASKDVTEQMLKIHSHLVTCSTSFAQAGAIAALSKKPLLGFGGMTFPEIISEWEKRRDAMVDGLNKIPGVSCVKGSGGYFTFPNFSTFNISSTEMCEFLLEEAKIQTTPGIEFGSLGEAHLRFPYSCAAEDIEIGLERLAAALEELKNQ